MTSSRYVQATNLATPAIGLGFGDLFDPCSGVDSALEIPNIMVADAIRKG